MSYFYSEPSLIRPPLVPNLFNERAEQCDVSSDALPDAFRSLTPGVFEANCALSELFYAIMTFNINNPVRERIDADSDKRVQFYAQLTEPQETWNRISPAGGGFTAQSCYLR